MQQLKLIALFICLGVTACSQRGVVTQTVELPHSETVKFKFPQLPSGVLTQLLVSQYDGEENQLIVRVEILADSISFVGLTDTGLDLFTINWQKDNRIEFWMRSFLPEQLKPEYVLADFLFTYQNMDEVRSMLSKTSVFEQQINHGKIRSFEQNDSVWLDISYKSDTAWSDVMFDNRSRRYQLSITTLEWEAHAKN